jgi:hypothetical protein
MAIVFYFRFLIAEHKYNSHEEVVAEIKYNNNIDLLLLNVEFHSNIVFIYDRTSQLVIISSLWRKTYRIVHFNNNWYKRTNNKRC